MRPTATPLFTPTEAAVLTRLPLKAVNNAIDKKTVPATAGRRAGQAARLLDLRALTALALERRLADRIVPEALDASFSMRCLTPSAARSRSKAALSKSMYANPGGSSPPLCANSAAPANSLSLTPTSWAATRSSAAHACPCTPSPHSLWTASPRPTCANPIRG